MTSLPTTASTACGPIDLAASSTAASYSESGSAGTIDEFRVNDDGSLTSIGQVTGLAAHVIEGLTAS